MKNKLMRLIDPTIFDNILEAVLITDQKFQLIYANPQFCNLTDMTERRLRSKDLSEIFPLKDWSSKLSINQETHFALPDQIQKPVQVCAETIDFSGSPALFFYVRDISVEGALQSKYRAEIREKENVIQRLDRKLFEVSFLLEISSILNLSVNTEETLPKAMQLTLEKFNLVRIALMSCEADQPRLFASAGLASDEKYWPKAMQDSPDKVIKIENNNEGSIKGCLMLEVRSFPAKEDRELLAAVTAQLINRVEQEVLYNSSITDEKTKLFNSRYLQIALDREVARHQRWGQIFGLIIVDIDHFKKFNDTYGHQVGDEVLIHVAGLIKSATRTTDVVARFGGEEFCIIAVKADMPGLKILMERVRSAIEKGPLISAQHGELKVTVSLGAALYPNDAKDKEELFARADSALYQAKGAGRNQFKLWSQK